MTPARAAAVGLGALTIVAAAPAVTTLAPLRRRWLPTLSGIAPGAHVALTLDDGPDPVSTPAFLDLLAAHDRRATFFVLGSQAAAHPALVRRISDEGHELAVHGWTHRCTLAVPPTRLARELRDAKRAIEDLAGHTVTWYRPPFGVLSTEALLACRSTGLSPVLWSAWGREWERSATPDRIAAKVRSKIRPGGTVLLHDTDLHSPRGDWRRTLEATERLLAGPLRGADVGPLRDHWPATRTASPVVELVRDVSPGRLRPVAAAGVLPHGRTEHARPPVRTP